MPRSFSNSAAVRFLDREKVLTDLRRAAAEARAARPEIVRVLLFGSLVRGNWTADSDADLIVVVRREFPEILDRSSYQIHTRSIPTDTLVYSETEFAGMAGDPRSFIGRNLVHAIDL